VKLCHINRSGRVFWGTTWPQTCSLFGCTT